MPATRLLRFAAFAGLLATVLVTPTANAQGPGAVALRRPVWTLTGSFEALRIGPESWGSGPALASAVTSDRGGVSSSGLPCRRSALVVTAVARLISQPHSPASGSRRIGGGALGATGFLVGDASELTDGGIGVYLAAHVTRWLTHALGLSVGANLRTASGVYPGIHGGVAVRF